MSRISDVIKNKNRIEKVTAARRKEELNMLKEDVAYKAKLCDDLKLIDIVLDDTEVEYVVISIEERNITKFSRLLYSEELIGYTVEQIEDSPNKFKIQRKFIEF